MYKCYFKAAIDVFLSICGIIVLAIPMFIIAIAIKAESKGPALFKQKRLGKGQKEFTVYKFRTMCDHAFEKGEWLRLRATTALRRWVSFCGKQVWMNFPRCSTS